MTKAGELSLPGFRFGVANWLRGDLASMSNIGKMRCGVNSVRDGLFSVG